MKKWLLIIAWISGTLCACRKDSPSPESAGIRLCLDASLPPVTKLQWAGGDENGYKVSFDAHDRILVYFRNAAGNQVGNEIVLPVDPASLSADGRRAAFSAGDISVPDGSTEIFTYLDSDAEPDYMTYGATPFVELAAQSGSLQEAMGRQIIAGSVPLEALEGSAGNLAGTVAFSYRTSLLKLELSFPEGSVPPVGTAITLKNEGKTFYNRVRLTPTVTPKGLSLPWLGLLKETRCTTGSVSGPEMILPAPLLKSKTVRPLGRPPLIPRKPRRPGNYTVSGGRCRPGSRKPAAEGSPEEDILKNNQNQP